MRFTLAVALGVFPALAAAQSDEPKPRPPSEREQRLQKAVDEVVALVEKHSKLEFQKPPKVRGTKHREWRDIVQREFEIEGGRELFEATVGTFGLYIAKTDEIVLSPLVVGPLTKPLGDDPPRHVLEGVAHHKATIAHEIVHALQQVHYQLPNKLEAAEKPDEILRYKHVIEGHAVLIEELIAEQELGLDGFMAKGPYTGLGALGADPSYLIGRRYFLHVLRTEGMIGVHAKLANPPTFEELVARAKKPLPPTPKKTKGDDVKEARR